MSVTSRRLGFACPRRLPAAAVVGCVRWLLLPALLAVSACTSTRLNTARENFYLGRFDQAAAALQTRDDPRRDPCLLLMERGMIRQAQGAYDASIRDWLDAMDVAERLDYLSLSRGLGSLTVSERTLAFTGAPYERTLLHAFAAKSYLALGLWDDAAVEARVMVERFDHLNGFPDDAYSRYLAGVCLEMVNETDNAALQYTAAAALLKEPRIDPRSGAIGGDGAGPAPAAAELICFVLIGRAPTEYGAFPDSTRWGWQPYAELYSRGRLLGRSHTLGDTARLMGKTNRRLAALRAGRLAARVAAKEVVARQVARENVFLGELTRLLLYASETPDVRRWETLPRWLQVARVACPPDLAEFEIVFRSRSGRPILRRTVTAPLVRNGRTFVSFCRDLSAPPAAGAREP